MSSVHPPRPAEQLFKLQIPLGFGGGQALAEEGGCVLCILGDDVDDDDVDDDDVDDDVDDDDVDDDVDDDDHDHDVLGFGASAEEGRCRMCILGDQIQKLCC